MEKLELKTSMVVGTAKGGIWSQVGISERENGKVILVLSIRYEGESDVLDLSEVGGSILSQLKIKCGSLSDLSQLPNCIGEVLPGEEGGLTIHVGVVVQDGHTLFVAGKGEVMVSLLRNGKRGILYSGGEPVSGEIKEGDRIAVATKEAFENIELSESQMDVEKLAVAIHGESDSSFMAVVVAEAVNKPEKLESSNQRKIGLGGLTGKLQAMFRRPMKIRQEQKKFNMWVGVALVLVLFVGVVIGVLKKSKVAKENTFNNLASSVSQKTSEAEAVGDLNSERAKYLLSQAKGELSSYLSQTEDMEYREKANKLLQIVNETEVRVFKKEQVSINTLVELSVLKEGLESKRMILDSQGNVLFPNRNSEQVVGMNLKDKSSFDVSWRDLGVARDVTEYDDELYLLLDSGVYVVSSQGGEVKQIIEPDELWGDVRLISVYGGSVYLLDTGQSEIWKYPALDEGYGSRRRWLGAGISLDLSNVVDMKVDGDIWIITSTGKLERYSRGVPLEFSMEGFPYQNGDTLVSPSSLYVSEDKVYVLENGAMRVVVFDLESGKYERQYESEEFARGQGIVELDGKVYVLLTDSVVWFDE